MTFRKYCSGMSQHELLDLSILPKAKEVKNFPVLNYKTRTEVEWLTQ